MDESVAAAVAAILSFALGSGLTIATRAVRGVVGGMDPDEPPTSRRRLNPPANPTIAIARALRGPRELTTARDILTDFATGRMGTTTTPDEHAAHYALFVAASAACIGIAKCVVRDRLINSFASTERDDLTSKIWLIYPQIVAETRRYRWPAAGTAEIRSFKNTAARFVVQIYCSVIVRDTSIEHTETIDHVRAGVLSTNSVTDLFEVCAHLFTARPSLGATRELYDLSTVLEPPKPRLQHRPLVRSVEHIQGGAGVAEDGTAVDPAGTMWVPYTDHEGRRLWREATAEERRIAEERARSAPPAVKEPTLPRQSIDPKDLSADLRAWHERRHELRTLFAQELPADMQSRLRVEAHTQTIRSMHPEILVSLALRRTGHESAARTVYNKLRGINDIIGVRNLLRAFTLKNGLTGRRDTPEVAKLRYAHYIAWCTASLVSATHTRDRWKDWGDMDDLIPRVWYSHPFDNTVTRHIRWDRNTSAKMRADLVHLVVSDAVNGAERAARMYFVAEHATIQRMPIHRIRDIVFGANAFRDLMCLSYLSETGPTSAVTFNRQSYF